MQLASLDSGRAVGQRPAATRASALDAPALSAPSTPRRAVPAPNLPPARAGLRALNPQLNQRVSSAQLTLEYLDQLAAELQTVRTELRKQLSTPSQHPLTTGDSKLEAGIRRVAEHWDRRMAATQGTLDARLQWHAEGQARRTFSIRGLDLASLRSGGPEVLSFALGGRGLRAASSVAIEPGLPEHVIVQRFDRALAPSGIRASRSEDGELRFSVPEAAWPEVRDSLAVRGEGQRFPTGRFSQVRIVPEADAIRPRDWKVDSAVSLRATRESVFTAEGLVRQARNAVNQAFAETALELRAMEGAVAGVAGAVDGASDVANTVGVADVVGGADVSDVAAKGASRAGTGSVTAEWCARFARSFAAVASGKDFQALAAVLPAVSGIHRDRVAALLGLTAD